MQECDVISYNITNNILYKKSLETKITQSKINYIIFEKLDLLKRIKFK